MKHASAVLLADFSLQSRAILTNFTHRDPPGRRPAAENLNFPGRVSYHRLANGLRVCTVQTPHLHGAVVALYVRAGSRYERTSTNGLSHFVEHMLFRGCAQYPNSFALNHAIEERCGMLIGETGRDYSLYQVSLHPRDLGGALDILGDLFLAPCFSDLDLERAIVLEEILDDFDEDGCRINTDDLARETLWSGHPLGFPITGPERNIRRFSRADVVRHFRRLYGARNMVLCVAGPVRPGAVLAQVRRAFGQLPPGRRLQPLPPPAGAKGPRFRTVRSDSAQAEIQILFRALADQDPASAALVALLRVLDDGMSTRLHYRVCDQKGLAYHVSAALDPLYDTSLLEIDSACLPEKLPQLASEIVALLSDLRTTLVSEEELDKAKRRYARDVEAGFDDLEGLCSWFGGSALFFSRPRSPAERYRRMAAVSAKQIREVARRVLQPERLVAVVVGSVDRKLSRRVEQILRDSFR
jgi:predicted Zn-dependent peptidase